MEEGGLGACGRAKSPAGDFANALAGGGATVDGAVGGEGGSAQGGLGLGRKSLLGEGRQGGGGRNGAAGAGRSMDTLRGMVVGHGVGGRGPPIGQERKAWERGDVQGGDGERALGWPKLRR